MVFTAVIAEAESECAYLNPIIRICLLTLCMFSQAGVAFCQDKLEKMHIGYSAQAGAFAPIWITKEAGLFQKNGLDVSLLLFPAGRQRRRRCLQARSRR
jgi:ABC-type nitrate/sulfonate/bicarbonate transport system substrate-binding protein